MFAKKYSLTNKIIVILLLMGLLTANIKVFANVKDEQVVELEEYLVLLEEEFPAVITGITRPLKKEEVPASITVVTADELRLLGLRHLTDVINYIVPGGIGDIHRSSRTGLYAFRGITVDNNGKYVFMVDGLNVGNLTWWGAFNERYLGLMDELDRIEIIQGTGSVLYGSGAISGIINFITKTGKQFQGTEVTAGYGSWDKVETSVKFGEQTSDGNDSFYYFGFKRSQGSTPKEGTGTGRGARDERSSSGRRWDHFDNSGKVHININRGDFSLRARYVRDRFEEPYTQGRPLNTSDNFWIENYFFVQPEIRRKLSENSRIKANISFVMNETGQEKTKDWVRTLGNPPVPATVISEGSKQSTAGERKLRAQLFHYYDGWTNHKLTTGIELFWMHSGPDFHGENRFITRRGDGLGGFDKIVDKFVEPENLYFGAVFFEDIWKVNKKTTIFTGARLEDHSRTRPNISPRLAISYDYSKKTNLKLLYNRGFRTPDWSYFHVNKNILGTDRPRPERVDSFEGHILHKFNDKFSASVIGYYTIYKDLINFFSTFGYTNFSKVRAAGLEFSGDYRTEKLKLGFSHSFSRPVHIAKDNYEIVELSSDRRNWAQFPTHMTKAHAIIHLIQDKVILGLTYFRPWGIKGQQNATSKLKWPANYLNATLTLKLNDDLDIQFSGYNLTHEDHPWWGADTRNGVSRDINPHTEFFVRLRWKF